MNTRKFKKWCKKNELIKETSYYYEKRIVLCFKTIKHGFNYRVRILEDKMKDRKYIKNIKRIILIEKNKEVVQNFNKSIDIY